MSRYSRTSWAYAAPSIALLLVIGWHWAQPPTVVAQIDLAPPYDVANMLGKCAAAWNHVHAFVGSVDNCFSWTPHYALQAVLQGVLGASYGQAATFIIPVILSWLGVYACARCLGTSEVAAFAAAWLYAFNPAQQSMIGLFATGEVCAAVLPWVFYWILLAARDPQRRRFATAALTTLTFAVVVILAITPQLLVALLAGTVLWLFFAASRAPERRSYWKWVRTTAVLVLLASLWWVVPNAVSYLGVAITHTADPLAIAWTFARASLLNELRFVPMWFWQYPEYNPWAYEADHNAVLYVSTLVPAAFLGLALIITRGRSNAAARFLALVALVMLFIAKGTHPPLAALNLLFYRIPGMFVFIEPYGAILIAALCAALAAGIAADAIIEFARERYRTAAALALGAVIVGAALTSNLATVTGAIFHEQSNGLPDVHIRLPGDWSALADRLNAAPERGGVAIFPADDFYQADYDWGFHGADLLPISLLRRPVLMPGAPLTYTQTSAAQSIDSQLARAVAVGSPAAARILHDIGVRYVVARGDVRPAHGFRWAPLRFAPLFGPPIARYGPLELYDLGPPAAPAHIVATQDLGRAPLSPDDTARAHVRVDPFRALGTGRERLSPVVPVVANQIQVSSTQTEYDVVNAGAAALACDVIVGVWPRSPTIYNLQSDDGTVRTAGVNDAAHATWARFSNVMLHQGTTRLLIGAASTFERMQWPFLPPRDNDAAGASRRVGVILFGLHSQPVRAPAPAIGVSLDARADGASSVTVHAGTQATPVSDNWVLRVTSPAGNFACSAILTRGLTYDLDDIVRACYSSTGRELSTADAGATIVSDMVLARGSEPHGSVTVRTMLPVSAPAMATAPEGSALPATPLPLDVGSAVVIAQRGPLSFATLDAFHATWSAFEIGASGISMPAHTQASGWQNAWLAAGPGTVYVVNWLVLLQWLLLAGGLITMVVAWRR